MKTIKDVINYYDGQEKTGIDKTQRRRFLLRMMLMTFICVLLIETECFAASASGTITAQFTKLQDVVTTIVSSIVAIITLWGISEFGISLNEGQGMGQAQAFKRIAGGLVMILAPQILTLIK